MQKNFISQKAMTPKTVTKEEESNLPLPMNEQRLRRAVSDISTGIDKIKEDYGTMMITINEEEQAKCECCGLIEDCTHDYIEHVKDSHSGKWVCGLCSEAVKERLQRAPRTAMEEAVSFQKDICQKFYSTTRLNPKLSLTGAMRDIAKRSLQHRNTKNSSISKIARSCSCDPRIDLKMN
ncbi:hypothetical protein HHK36_021669 [Tetracentron sinense]|uniref:Uncharacterized protein n=1 Tax=Tetracentron sinense TaxID=13715 RepID=A0A834YSL3_TETSI|nr:hypothetical protein HHK36_021669 [Tetracentron sinense]